MTHRTLLRLLFGPLSLNCCSLMSSESAMPHLPSVEPQVVSLWPDGSPNNPAGGPRPNMEIYHTFDPARPVNATIVILPGGGYRFLIPFSFQDER